MVLGLTGIGEYSKQFSMKATLDIPDDLYRQVKARSAMEGRPLRAVAMELFQNWLHGARPTVETALKATAGEAAAPWLAITQPYAKSGMRHDMKSIRAAMAKGWAEESDVVENPTQG